MIHERERLALGFERAITDLVSMPSLITQCDPAADRFFLLAMYTTPQPPSPICCSSL